MEKIRPMHDGLVVKLKTQPDKTPGGLIIPEAAKEKPVDGEVLAAGPGAVLPSGGIRALDVKVGDRIIFGRYAGTEFESNGEKLTLLKEDDVFAVIET